MCVYTYIYIYTYIYVYQYLYVYAWVVCEYRKELLIINAFKTYEYVFIRFSEYIQGY